MESHTRQWQYFCVLAFICINSSSVIARNIERYDTAYECEGKTLKIECQEDELIHLIRANYGRFSITICNEHGNTDWSVNCMSPKSFRVLYNKCNQQQNCSIVASTSHFGDPCPNTLKYLEAHYQCVSTLTTTMVSRPTPPWLLTSQPSIWGTSTPAGSTTHLLPGISTLDTTNLSEIVVTSIFTSPPSKPTSIKTWVKEDFIVDKVEEKQIKGKINVFSTIQSNRPTLSPKTTLKSSILLQQPEHLTQEPLTSTLSTWKTRQSTSVTAGDSMCPRQLARNLIWNATRIDDVAVQSCPGGANGLARWQCISIQRETDVGKTATWQRGTPDLSECRSVWLSSLEKRVQEGELILGISSDLSQVTNNSSELYGGDMLITTKILKKMTERMTQNIALYQDPRQREVSVAELLQGAVTTGSNLLDKAQSASWKDLSHQEQMVVATSLLIGLEENAFLLANTLNYEKNIVHERRNILMEVRVLEVRNIKKKLEIFPRELSQRNRWAKLHNRVELTRTALLGNDNTDGFVRLVFMAFDRLEEILQPHPDDATTHPTNSERKLKPSLVNVTRILNSKVISASLGKGKHVQLTEPVRLYFQHLTQENVSNPRCVFWDYAMSGWSEEGCITRKSNETHTICECNHLTNFAVLMDVRAVKLNVGHQVALEIITYIGCIISIVCLILAITIFQLFRGLKSDRTTIHENLCVCLLVAEVLFVCGIGQTNQRIVCGIIAGLLHFFFLCAFAWMFLEGFQLYVMLIEVFEVEKSRLRWYYLIAYGIPLLVVAISCMIDPLSYGTDRYCWLRADNYFIFSFVGPVILVILANMVFLSMAIYMMCKHTNTTIPMKNKEYSQLADTRTWLRGAVILMFLLGLTWTFGLLYLNQESVIMAYIFTALNSLQGLFIFVFHCVQNEKVQKEYGKFIRRYSWLPKCLRCSNDSSSSGTTSGTSGVSTGASGGSGADKDFASHNTSSKPSDPTTDSSGLSPQHVNSNKISFKSHSRDSGHGGSEQDDSPHVLAHTSSYSPHNAMTLQGYSLRARERRLLGELEVGSRATTGRRAASPYNHTYTEIREARLQHAQHHFQQQQQLPQHDFSHFRQDDPVYEEIERVNGGKLLISCPEVTQTSDMSDEDGRRQSDMSRQSSRSYGDHRPLIPYSPANERGLEASWAFEKLRRQQQQFPKHQQHLEVAEQSQHQPRLQQQDHTRTVAVLDGHTVVCHLQPQTELHASRGFVPPSYSEC